MNLSDWIKAAALITQQKQEAAATDTDQLSSVPLSQLAMDDSGPPVVHYGMHMPAATSTPTHTEVHTHRPLQFSQSNYIHCLLLPMKSPCQPKR